ncbi:MAG: hypothetical protein GXP42_03870 [Chloroflexi bacterium]|nr:hypothetical protein [Chloroflexota bacterium]
MSRKAIIVISDTHIGAGGREAGNKLEDFISDAEFVDWLHDLVQESNRDRVDMDLVINGDWIEFLQIPSVDRFEPHRQYETEEYTNPAESEALQRLEVLREWHPSIFLGMADFLNPGPPRRAITILYGNHDPETAYPAVQERLREMLNAQEHPDLLTVGVRRYFKDGVFIEHGNAYVEEVNRFTDPDHPFESDNPDTVERPPGSLFVTYFFNPMEWERPWIDGVHPLTSLIFYALAFEPRFALDVLRVFLKVAPNALEDIVLAKGVASSSTDQILEQIDEPEQAEAIAQRLQSDPEFRAAFTQQVTQALIEKGAAPPAVEGVAGLAMEIPPEVRARELTERYWRILENKADEIAREHGAQVVLFGHIHEFIDKTLPSGAKYINTGTWVWKGDFSEAPEQVWQDLVRNPEKYANQRDLRYARIDYDEGGRIVGAGLHRIGGEPTPPPPPGPQPEAGFWAKLILLLKDIFQRFFG